MILLYFCFDILCEHFNIILSMGSKTQLFWDCPTKKTDFRLEKCWCAKSEHNLKANTEQTQTSITSNT